MRLCSIGFSLCVFPVAGSPGFQSGGARLQACGKSASTRRPSESVWQLPFRVRARFQPCRNCRQINKASAAEGLAFQLPRRLFSPGPAPSGTACSSPSRAFCAMIPGRAPVECGQSTYRLLRHFSFSRHSFTLLVPSLSATGRLRGERSRRVTALHSRSSAMWLKAFDRPRFTLPVLVSDDSL